MSENLIGCNVRCAVTGFSGIAYQRTDMLGGTIQYSVQPKCPDEKNYMPDGMSIDEIQLDKVDDGISARRTEPVYPAVELGNEVEDIVSGHRGIVTSRVTFLNGCVYFNVESKRTTKEKHEESRIGFYPSARIKVVGAGVAEKAEPEATAKPKRSTGGPMTRAQRLA